MSRISRSDQEGRQCSASARRGSPGPRLACNRSTETAKSLRQPLRKPSWPQGDRC
ncbi:hypothetical protein ACFPRL_36270 [Pseudoclavibacter helvolus]